MMWPRDYLSHSQKSTWKASKKSYFQKYIYDKSFSSRETRYGSMVAEALEHDEDTGDIATDLMLAQFPQFEVRDQPLLVELIVDKKQTIPLFGKLDSSKKDYSAFKEFKTGRTKWNQAKVDRDAQITFYATMCYLKTKKVPEDIELVWMQTELADGEVTPTGHLEVFKTKRTLSDIINEMADITQVWNEIGEAYEKELLQ